jgi:hypothetical protein
MKVTKSIIFCNYCWEFRYNHGQLAVVSMPLAGSNKKLWGVQEIEELIPTRPSAISCIFKSGLLFSGKRWNDNCFALLSGLSLEFLRSSETHEWTILNYLTFKETFEQRKPLLGSSNLRKPNNIHSTELSQNSTTFFHLTRRFRAMLIHSDIIIS